MTLGKALFFLSWTVAAIMWLIFAVGLVTGRYKNISEKEWKEQLW